MYIQKCILIIKTYSLSNWLKQTLTIHVLHMICNASHMHQHKSNRS